MSLTLDATTTVRDLVTRHPGARRSLEALGLDVCCGGGRPVAEAAAAAGVSLSAVLAALDEDVASPSAAAEASWATATLTALADHIEATHHATMRALLPRASADLVKVLGAHGARHGERLRALQAVFEDMRREIEMHLMKEEQILFPYIRQMEAQVAATGTVPPMHCGTVQNPIRQMEAEHESAGDALAQMRALTDGYTLPADACPTFAGLYETLQAIEADLHAHIHKENNILFPRAIAMEGA
ncbi:MAG: iron-sulfur cluster repair di-iron protein [Lentisphaerae bacterium]|nr:iron-sulfur cluster repair di-iron protein [Lentisphaerota bacterium]